MKFHIIEDKKNLLVFELEDVSHEIGIALEEQLYKDKNVVVATYRTEHPLIRKIRFYLETKDASPRDVLKKAIKSLMNTNKKILNEINKAL